MILTHEQYLEQLPRGVDSYPHALIKGSVIAQVLDDLPRDIRVETGVSRPTALTARARR